MYVGIFVNFSHLLVGLPEPHTNPPEKSTTLAEADDSSTESSPVYSTDLGVPLMHSNLSNALKIDAFFLILVMCLPFS